MVVINGKKWRSRTATLSRSRRPLQFVENFTPEFYDKYGRRYRQTTNYAHTFCLLLSNRTVYGTSTSYFIGRFPERVRWIFVSRRRCAVERIFQFSIYSSFFIFLMARVQHEPNTRTEPGTERWHTNTHYCTAVPSVCVRTPEFTVYVRLHFIRIRLVNYWKHMKYTACDYIWYPQFIIRHTTTLITQCRLLSTVVVS